MKFSRRSKVFVLVIAICVALAFTPVGEAVLGFGYFVASAIEYGRESKAITERVEKFGESDYRKLVAIASKLVSAERSSSTPQEEVRVVPPALEYLNPRRVWVAADSVTIQLVRMMDSEITLAVERDAQGMWKVVGHFGDYMNAPRVLWLERKAPNPESSVSAKPDTGLLLNKPYSKKPPR